MPYFYSDPTRESDPHAQPNVEVFDSFEYEDSTIEWNVGEGWYYAFGFPGCLWDGEPVGPFNTEEEALEAARG